MAEAWMLVRCDFQGKDVESVKIISNTISSSEENYKYFIGYKDDDYKVVTPLYIILPQKSWRTRSFDKTKCISFLIGYDLLEKYNKIWDSHQ